jgi:hypothetical protein
VTPARRALSGAATALLSLVLSLAALEGTLRLAWNDYYVRTPRENVEPHPTRGFANRPGVRLEYGKAEYHVTVAHSSRGFRCPELPPHKPPGRTRVLVLGDSMTYGLGAENHETYAARLEQLDPRLEVINAGVPGYSAAEELLLLDEEGPSLEPDLVLVGFFFNDLPGAFKSGVRFTLEDGELRYHPPEAPPVKESSGAPGAVSLWSRSYLYRFTSDRITLLRYWLGDVFGFRVRATSVLLPEEVEPAWQLSFALLRRIAERSAELGARTLVAVIPDQAQVETDVSVVGLDPSLFTIQQRLTAFGRESGIPVLDLLPGMRAGYAGDGTRLYYRYDRHLRPEGHARVAELILTGGRELALLPPPG